MSDRSAGSGSVVVTGVGIVSPAGTDTEATWRTLMANSRCVTEISDPALTGGGAVCAGCVPGFVSPPGLEDADRVCQLAVAAADRAATQACLSGGGGSGIDPDRLGISFGTSKGGILAFGSAFDFLAATTVFRTGDCRKRKKLEDPKPSYSLSQDPLRSRSETPLSALYTTYISTVRGTSYKSSNALKSSYNLFGLLYDVPPDAAARRLAARFGAAAGTHATVAACATGSLAVIRAVQMVVDGQADVVIAGAADASLHPLWFAAFRQMGVLAGPHPRLGAGWACQPFDRDRRGFAISEGAAAMVIESAQSARRRGIRPLARISGYAMGTDPGGLAAVEPNGAPLAETIKIACRRAAVKAAHIAAVQAHGTGTPANDAAEINGLRNAGLSGEEVPVVSYKGSLGHLLGAAGAVELAIAVLAIQRGTLPGNATILEADPALKPAWLPTEPVQLRPGAILKTSLAFGGHLAAIVLESAEADSNGR